MIIKEGHIGLIYILVAVFLFLLKTNLFCFPLFSAACHTGNEEPQCNAGSWSILTTLLHNFCIWNLSDDCSYLVSPQSVNIYFVGISKLAGKISKVCVYFCDKLGWVVNFEAGFFFPPHWFNNLPLWLGSEYASDVPKDTSVLLGISLLTTKPWMKGKLPSRGYRTIQISTLWRVAVCVLSVERKEMQEAFAHFSILRSDQRLTHCEYCLLKVHATCFIDMRLTFLSHFIFALSPTG